MRFRVDPRKVRAVVMHDGTHYPVARNGAVSIDRPDHLAEIRTSPARHDTVEAQITGFELHGAGIDGKTCSCGFAAWRWTRTCPRCGAAL